MGFLTAIPLRFWIIGALCAALAFAIWREDHTHKRLVLEQAKTAQVTAALEAERANRQKEHEVNEQIDKQLIAANQALEAERSKPLPHLSCRLRNNPSMPGTNPAPGVDHADAEGHDGRTDAQDPVAEFDPSEQLMEFAVEAQINRDGWQACEDWIRASR